MRVGILLLIAGSVYGQKNALVSRTSLFVEHLSPAQEQKTQYKFEDAERFNWHFVPRSRNGVALRDLSEEQRKEVFELLKL